MTPRPSPTGGRVWAARLLAVAVDGVQILLLPLFGTGFLSPATNVVDVVTAATMTYLLGWHWAFLPTFVAEIIPGVGLAPTWTIAVWIATRKRV